MHINRFSSKSYFDSSLNVKEERWHTTVFLALCSWSLSLPFQDGRTVHVRVVQGLPVRCFRSPKKWHTVVACVLITYKKRSFLQSILFSIPLPLKETYPGWNHSFKSHHLDFQFQQAWFKPLQPLYHFAAEDVSFSEFWTIGANSNNCHHLLATSNQQIWRATSCNYPFRQQAQGIWTIMYQRKRNNICPSPLVSLLTLSPVKSMKKRNKFFNLIISRWRQQLPNFFFFFYRSP